MYQLSEDGFSQDGVREPINKNDIPDLLQNWNQRALETYLPEDKKHGWVSVENILTNPELELAPRSYLVRHKATHDYPVFRVDELCTLEKGTASAANAIPGKFPLVTTAEELKSCSSYQFDCEAVCVPLVSSTGHGHASIKRLTYIKGKFAAASIIAVLRVKDEAQILPRYLYYLLESHKDDLLVPLMKGAANVSLSLGKIGSVRIPVPPIKEQNELLSDLFFLDSKIDETRAELNKFCLEKIQALETFKAEFC
jgi:hypothetical protein